MIELNANNKNREYKIEAIKNSRVYTIKLKLSNHFGFFIKTIQKKNT